MHQYGENLKQYWEVPVYAESPRLKDNRFTATIDTCRVNLIYEYVVTNLNNFSVRLIHTPNQLMWMHDMDGDYFSFPMQKFITSHNKRTEAVKEMNSHHVGKVVESLLIHPTPHQHIESPIDRHEIRIGGGIYNPFIYLFHLRIQLCPIHEKNKRERERLIELFKRAISKNIAIKPNELMAETN